MFTDEIHGLYNATLLCQLHLLWVYVVYIKAWFTKTTVKAIFIGHSNTKIVKKQGKDMF